MRKIFTVLKNKKGSMLVSSIMIASVVLVSILSILIIQTYHIKLLQLEKENRISKILIHKVWHDIYYNRKDYQNNQMVLFNIGTVYINRENEIIYLTAKLNNGTMTTQRYVDFENSK